MIAIMIMLFSLPANAEGTVGYAQWDELNTTLTFKGGGSVPDGAYALNIANNTPGWNSTTIKGSVTKVVFDESFKDVRPTSCYRWFRLFSKLKTIEGIENLNTEEVTNMGDMFNSCSGLTSLDLSSFNTAEVTDMRYMFDGCQKLTSLKLSNFNTANVTNMSYMFNNCRELTSLDLSDFDTANVTNMSYMFSDCKKFTSLDLSNFDTSNVTDMFQMFYECSGLTSLDLSSFNTAEVENMSYMFNGCSGLTSLNLSSFNTAEVKNMSYMFFGCSGLTTLDVSKFNTAKVENMSYMFYDCSGLKNLDLSSFNTAEVTDMSGMFNYSENLTTIYVSDGFDTRKASSSSMFESCFALVGAAQYSPSNTDQSMANYTTGYFKTYFTLGDSKVELCGNPLTTESLNLSDNYDFTPKYDFKAVSATYSRDLSSSNSTWFSLCLPFAYTPGNNFTAYQLKGATANAVEIEEITGEIAAGTPVLFKFKGGVVDVNKKINISETKAEIVKAPVNGAKVNGTDGSSLQLCGTYQTKTFSSEDNNAFILLNDKLMNPARMLTTPGVTSVSVKPFRAYMTLTASAESSAQTSSARAFSIGHGGEEGTTAIDLLNSVATDDAEYYDINGRRIDAPAKGVNIVRRGNKTIKLIIK